MNGSVALPLNQSDESEIRGKFLNKVVGVTPRQYREFWIRKMFTGKGVPPKAVEGEGHDSST